MAPNLAVGKRYQVLGMLKAGKKPREISDALNALNIHVSSVYDILKKAAETNESLEDKKRSGRPISKLT